MLQVLLDGLTHAKVRELNRTRGRGPSCRARRTANRCAVNRRCRWVCAWCAQVADFGISKTCKEPDGGNEASRNDGSQTAQQHTVGVGTPRYTAPEVFACGEAWSHTEYDERVDVYSFGLLLWEMTHNQIVFDSLPGFAVVMQVRTGARPTISLASGSSDIEGFAELIAACWHHEPSKRPSMSACAAQLATRLRQLEGSATNSTARHRTYTRARDTLLSMVGGPAGSSSNDDSSSRRVRPSPCLGAVGGDVSSPSSWTAKFPAAVSGLLAASRGHRPIMAARDPCNSHIYVSTRTTSSAGEGSGEGGSVDGETSGPQDLFAHRAVLDEAEQQVEAAEEQVVCTLH